MKGWVSRRWTEFWILACLFGCYDDFGRIGAEARTLIGY